MLHFTLPETSIEIVNAAFCFLPFKPSSSQRGFCICLGGTGLVWRQVASFLFPPASAPILPHFDALNILQIGRGSQPEFRAKSV